MTAESSPSAKELRKLLDRIENTKPVPKEVRCESPSGVMAWAKNPEWPPHRKGECEAADYGMWLYEEMPKLLGFIRSVEKAKEEAISIAVEDGGIDGDHHKRWVIDQMVRALTHCPDVQATAKDCHGEPYTYMERGESEEYRTIVREAMAGEDGPHTYDWDVGTPP